MKAGFLQPRRKPGAGDVAAAVAAPPTPAREAAPRPVDAFESQSAAPAAAAAAAAASRPSPGGGPCEGALARLGRELQAMGLADADVATLLAARQRLRAGDYVRAAAATAAAATAAERGGRADSDSDSPIADAALRGPGGGGPPAAAAAAPLKAALAGFVAAAAAAAAGGPRPTVVYVGGSVTAQRDGWRPRVHAALEGLAGRPLRAVCAAMGNLGAKLLCFLADEWVTRHGPDLIFVETAINDGDDLLPELLLLAAAAAPQPRPQNDCDDRDGTRRRARDVRDGGRGGPGPGPPAPGAGRPGPEAGVTVRRGLEGLIRRLRTACPRSSIVLVDMLLRPDVPRARRTGTQAWADAAEAGLASAPSRAAAAVYSCTVPAMHAAVAGHYGLPVLALNSALSELHLSTATLDLLFRDDVHHTAAGAAFVAHVAAEALEGLLREAEAEAERAQHVDRAPGPRVGPDVHDSGVGGRSGRGGAAPRPAPLLPAPLDPRFWCGGRVLPIADAQIHLRRPPAPALTSAPASAPASASAPAPASASALVPAPAAPLALRRDRRRRDADPLSGAPADWWLLAPGDELLLPFEGTALGLLSYVGPDSGCVHVEVRSRAADSTTSTITGHMHGDRDTDSDASGGPAAGGPGPVIARSTVQLFDRWCYYYRLAAVLLVEGLPPGAHVARVWLDAAPPDRSLAAKPVPAGVQGPLRLWLREALVLGGDGVGQSRALADFPTFGGGGTGEAAAAAALEAPAPEPARGSVFQPRAGPVDPKEGDAGPGLD